MLTTALLLIALQFPAGVAEPVPVAPESPLPQYAFEAPVRGPLSSVGSSTVGFIMSETSAAFGALHPDVAFSIEGAGSGTAPPALTGGRAALAPMSRRMRDGERAAFEARFGCPPTAVPVAIDAVAVFVHRDNPIAGLTLDELDRALGTAPDAGTPAVTWGDLGLTGDWAGEPIVPFGLPDNYGVHSILRREVLGGDPFRSDLRMQYGSSLVAQEVGAERGGIGFTSLFFDTARTRPLPLGRTGGVGGVPAEPTRANILSGRYPLGRTLWVYVNKAPDRPLPPQVAEFLRFVLSAQGQRVIADAGYYPLPADLAAEARTSLGLN